jgi:hypothetical protein
MPGRTRGQLVLFEQDHIRPTQVRKVICDAASGHSATDDDDACARGQILTEIAHRIPLL